MRAASSQTLWVLATSVLLANGRTTSTAPLAVIPLDKQYVPIRRNNQIVSYKTAYSGRIYVGSGQPQNFSVVFDTGSGHIFLPSTSCQSKPCQSHARYDPGKSSSVKFIDHLGRKVDESEDEVAISFGTGSIRGQFVEELVCLIDPQTGTMATPNHEECVRVRLITANQMTEEPFESFSFDGVMGLGLAALAVDPAFNVFEQFARRPRTEFTSQFAYFLSDDDSKPSEISFGGHDARRMQSALRWAPVHKPHLGFWQVRVQRVSVGGQDLSLCADGDCVAIADTGTSLLGAPRQFTQQLHRLLARRVPGKQDVDMDCREFPGPDVVFELEGGVEVRLGGKEYSRAAPMKVGATPADIQILCRASLLPVDPTPALGSKTFILGEPALRKYYTVYDWEQKSVGFALAQQAASSRPHAPNTVHV
mmetsp:Transcript_22422/g.42310  ORF Transcript_22422/g.42310 Transcript_22422/m.42310 type:complete len:421 (+) Transcript_22422:86-1348(+)